MGIPASEYVNKVSFVSGFSRQVVASNLTVAIPTIGRIELLQNCLNSIVSGRVIPLEVVLGDQSNGNAVADLAEKMSAQLPIRVISSSGAGIACNLNQIILGAKTELILVTHDDCRVDEHWVQQGQKALQNTSGVLVTGKVLPGGGRINSVPSTIVQEEAEDLTNSLQPGRLYPANMGIYRSTVLELGGFDERAGFRHAAEDLDFAYRWLRAGRSMQYQPSMVVVHEDWREQAELARLYRLYARAGGRFFGKHLYDGDSHAARMALNDIRTGFKAWGKRLLSKSDFRNDPRLARPIWIPVGMVEGIYESWQLNKGTRTRWTANE